MIPKSLFPSTRPSKRKKSNKMVFYFFVLFLAEKRGKRLSAQELEDELDREIRSGDDKKFEEI